MKFLHMAKKTNLMLFSINELILKFKNDSNRKYNFLCKIK